MTKQVQDGQTDPADGLRSLEQLVRPDLRMSFLSVRDGAAVRPLSQEDRHTAISKFTLNDAVPEPIKVQFDTARNLFLYAWFVYRFHVVAEQHAMSTLELALRTKLVAASVLNSEGKHNRVLPPKTQGGPPRTKTSHVGLSDLMTLAVEHGFLGNHRIPDRESWARRLAEGRQSIELARKMTELGLIEMEVTSAPLCPNEEELNFDWIGHLASTLPKVRNIHAHGSSMLYTSVLWTFEVVQVLVNQLFVSDAAPDA